MTSGVPLDKAQIIQAIKQKGGIITKAAKQIGIDPRSIYDWMDRDQEVADAVKDARALAAKNRQDMEEDMIEEAYRSLNYLLKSNDTTATIFTMKCKAKWSDKAGDPVSESISKIEIVDYSKE